MEPAPRAVVTPARSARARVPGSGQHDLGIRATGDRGDRAFGRVERVVGVGVDQSGKQGAPAAVDDRDLAVGAGRPGSCLTVVDDGRDPLAVHDDVDILTSGLGHPVDEPDRLEDRAHRAILPTGPTGRG